MGSRLRARTPQHAPEDAPAPPPTSVARLAETGDLLARHLDRAERRDALRWVGLVAVGLLAVAAAVAADVRFGTASAPFVGEYRAKAVIGTPVAPAVAAVVLLAAARGVHERWSWRPLLLASWVAAVAWTAGLASVDGGNGFARPLTEGGEYLPDVDAFAADPLGFLGSFVDDPSALTAATRRHPPGPVFLLWVLTRFGVARATSLGVVIMLIGCVTVPLVAVAVRSLAGERAARRLLPLLVLAPWAVWVAVSLDAVVATLGAAHLALAVLAGEDRRAPHSRLVLAVLAGLLLGVAVLFSYSVAWLGLGGILAFFVRRRSGLVVLAGLAALVPLFVVQALGFTWTDGLAMAQADFAERVQPARSWRAWAVTDVLVLLVAAGPAVLASARKARRTPAWPFLVAAVAAVAFSVAAGIARGEVERLWLPFFPWLLVAATAPEEAPPPGRVADDQQGVTAPTRAPLLLVALGAAAAVVLEAVLQTSW